MLCGCQFATLRKKSVSSLKFHIFPTVHPRSRVGFLQARCVCVSELRWHPSQHVQKGQIHKTGFLGGRDGGGRVQFQFGNNSIVRVKESVWSIVFFFWTWKVHKSQRQCQCTSYIWESCPSLLLPAWGEWQHVSIVQIWIFVIKKPGHGLVVTCFTCHLKKIMMM